MSADLDLDDIQYDSERGFRVHPKYVLALIDRVKTAEQERDEAQMERADAEQERDSWRGMYRVAARRSEDHLFPGAEGRDRTTDTAEARLAKVKALADEWGSHAPKYSMHTGLAARSLREALGGEQHG